MNSTLKELNTIHLKNRFNIFLVVFLLCMLTACTPPEPTTEKEDLPDPLANMTYAFESPDSGQSFKIVHVYSLFKNYLTAVHAQPDKTRNQLYHQEVLQPIRKTCFTNPDEYRELTAPLQWISNDVNLDELAKQVTAIDEDQLNKSIEDALVASSNILSSKEETTICVFPENNEALSDMMTIGEGEIIVFHESFDKLFKSAIAHEYHHSVKIRQQSSEKGHPTQLDGFVMEGGAMYFENLVYPELNHSHYYLDTKFNKSYWSLVENDLEQPLTMEFLETIIIGGSNGIPLSYGYSEGYKMIQAYIERHPEISVKEWTALNSKEIFNGGNYLENYR